MKKLFFGLTISFGLIGCIKEEQPIDQSNLQEGLTRVEIPIGFDRDKQFYFKMSSGLKVREVNVYDFDIMFDASANGVAVYMNNARFMGAAPTGKFNMNEVNSVNGVQWRYDIASLHPDSTAVGQWITPYNISGTSNGEVYLIHLGFDKQGNILGYKKMQFLSVNSVSYTVRFADLNGGNEATVTINKSDNHNFVYLSFKNGGSQPDIEPPVNDWDLWFTQYTDLVRSIFDNLFYPYSVNGVIQNPRTVTTAMDSTRNIMDYTLADANLLNFSTRANKIGYDWKLFLSQSATGSYIIKHRNVYFVRLSSTEIYALRFVDFLDNTGTTGFPTFEFRKLE